MTLLEVKTQVEEGNETGFFLPGLLILGMLDRRLLKGIFSVQLFRDFQRKGTVPETLWLPNPRSAFLHRYNLFPPLPDTHTLMYNVSINIHKMAVSLVTQF